MLLTVVAMPHFALQGLLRISTFVTRGPRAAPRRLDFIAILVVLIAAALAALPERATAQQLPAALRVSREYALQMNASSLSLSPALQAETELRRDLKRARTQLVVGTALALSGIAHAAVFGNRHVCYESQERLVLPIVTGSAVAAAGVTLVFNGGFKLAGIPSDFRRSHPASAGRRTAMAFGALGVAAVSQAVLGAIVFAPLYQCLAS